MIPLMKPGNLLLQGSPLVRFNTRNWIKDPPFEGPDAPTPGVSCHRFPGDTEEKKDILNFSHLKTVFKKVGCSRL